MSHVGHSDAGERDSTSCGEVAFPNSDSRDSRPSTTGAYHPQHRTLTLVGILGRQTSIVTQPWGRACGGALISISEAFTVDVTWAKSGVPDLVEV